MSRRTFRARPLARPAALGLAVALVLPLAACTDAGPADATSSPAPSSAPTAGAATSPDPAPDAATTARATLAWLGSLERTDGLLTTVFDGTAYPDHGLTLDVLVAALAADDAVLAAELAGVFTPEVVDAYAGDGTSAAYAGSTAKGAVVLGAAGSGAAATLEARLPDLLAESGRLSDLGSDDYSSTVTQAWAVLALARPGARASDGGAERVVRAATYLVEQRCEDGAFPAVLEADTCVADVDATAFALSALAGLAAAAPGDAAEVGATEVVADAAAWLAAAATPLDGAAAWETGEPASANANSTAVALVALADAGSTARPLVAGRDWLLARTVTSDDGVAVTFDGTTPDARASAQAVPALLGVGLAGLAGSGT